MTQPRITKHLKKIKEEFQKERIEGMEERKHYRKIEG